MLRAVILHCAQRKPDTLTMTRAKFIALLAELNAMRFVPVHVEQSEYTHVLIAGWIVRPLEGS